MEVAGPLGTLLGLAAIRRGEGAQRKRCRDPRCSPRGNPACRGTFGPQPSRALGGELSGAFMNSCIEGSSDTWGGRAVSGQALGRPPPTCPVSLWQTRIACLSHLPQVGVPIFILGYRRGAPRKPPWVFPPQTPSPSVPGALPIPCTHAPAILPPMGQKLRQAQCQWLQVMETGLSDPGPVTGIGYRRGGGKTQPKEPQTGRQSDNGHRKVETRV